MNYLSDRELYEIAEEVELVSIKNYDDILSVHFDSHIEEYNRFLKIAREYDETNISKTLLLIHSKTKELLAYMTLSTDSIKLTSDEKDMHDLSDVSYSVVPALKIGKLAVNKDVSENVKRKGYGSFLIETAGTMAMDVNELGVACRFLTVDADIDYNKDTPQFYKKNGFVENLSNKSRKPNHTISMRKDILV